MAQAEFLSDSQQSGGDAQCLDRVALRRQLTAILKPCGPTPLPWRDSMHGARRQTSCSGTRKTATPKRPRRSVVLPVPCPGTTSTASLRTRLAKLPPTPLRASLDGVALSKPEAVSPGMQKHYDIEIMPRGRWQETSSLLR